MARLPKPKTLTSSAPSIPAPAAIGDNHFASVRKAREALRVRAFELLDGYIAVIKQAAAAGDYETAAKSYQYLFDHMPEEEGQRLMEISIDKPKHVEQRTGPNIQIGFALGGVAPAKELPAAAVIDVTPDGQ